MAVAQVKDPDASRQVDELSSADHPHARPFGLVDKVGKVHLHCLGDVIVVQPQKLFLVLQVEASYPLGVSLDRRWPCLEWLSQVSPLLKDFGRAWHAHSRGKSHLRYFLSYSAHSHEVDRPYGDHG